MLPALIAPIVGLISSVIDKAIPDKTQAADLKAKITLEALNSESEELKAATDIILAEANGESWLQRNWRPSLMSLFGLIIFNNYVLYPYLSLFMDNAPVLDIPPDMWDLLKLGIGGYIASRGGEKMLKEYKK